MKTNPLVAKIVVGEEKDIHVLNPNTKQKKWKKKTILKHKNIKMDTAAGAKEFMQNLRCRFASYIKTEGP